MVWIFQSINKFFLDLMFLCFINFKRWSYTTSNSGVIRGPIDTNFYFNLEMCLIYYEHEPLQNT
jgi:hypothetical protein